MFASAMILVHSRASIQSQKRFLRSANDDMARSGLSHVIDTESHKITTTKKKNTETIIAQSKLLNVYNTYTSTHVTVNRRRPLNTFTRIINVTLRNRIVFEKTLKTKMTSTPGPCTVVAGRDHKLQQLLSPNDPPLL